MCTHYSLQFCAFTCHRCRGRKASRCWRRWRAPPSHRREWTTRELSSSIHCASSRMLSAESFCSRFALSPTSSSPFFSHQNPNYLLLFSLLLFSVLISRLISPNSYSYHHCSVMLWHLATTLIPHLTRVQKHIILLNDVISLTKLVFNL